jgi:ribosomal protein S18 acetylase RimI-like enzyme
MPAQTLRLARLSKKRFDDERKRLVDVYVSAYQRIPEYAYTDRPEIVSYLNWLFRGDRKGFYVVRQGKSLVAWMSVHDSWRGWRGNLRQAQGELQELVIAEPFQGQGLGRRMLTQAIKHVAKAGRTSMGLYVGEHNDPAKALYEKFGFVEESRWGIWIRMQRPIDPMVDKGGERDRDHLEVAEPNPLAVAVGASELAGAEHD